MLMLSGEAFVGLTGSRKTYTHDAEFDARIYNPAVFPVGKLPQLGLPRKPRVPFKCF
jgi:hypothetical protein